MTFVVRTIEEHELVPWLSAVQIPFFLDHSSEEEAEPPRGNLDLSRTWAAFDQGRIVGTLRSFATSLTLPGPRQVAADALSQVTVSPTHRRRGLLTRMIAANLTEARERGEAVSILIAAEYPIYGRFGYGAAVEHATYTVNPRAAQFHKPASGVVEMIDVAEFQEIGARIADELRRRQPGSIQRSDRFWAIQLGLRSSRGRLPWRGRIVIARDGNADITGYVQYHVEGTWDERRPGHTLVVDDLVSLTAEAYAALWQYLCGIDLLREIRAPLRCVDEPLPWMLRDARVISQVVRCDLMWVRPLDVSAALASRTYLADGEVVVNVIDEQRWAAGRYALAGGPAGAQCEPTRSPADLTLTAATLGSILIGGVSLMTLAAAGQVEEHRRGALAQADAMFRSSIMPWCNTWF